MEGIFARKPGFVTTFGESVDSYWESASETHPLDILDLLIGADSPKISRVTEI